MDPPVKEEPEEAEGPTEEEQAIKDGETTKYVALLETTRKADGTVIVSYGAADIHVDIDPDGAGPLLICMR